MGSASIPAGAGLRSLTLLDSVALRECYASAQTIYDAGDPTEYWYRVESGGARQVALWGDGRRQILAFLVPGDFFGFSAHAQHRISAEAVANDTVIARYPRREAEHLAATNLVLAEQIRQMTFESLSRLEDRLVDIGRPMAIQRVASFLLELADRPCAPKRSVVQLEMSRFDIADYLAVSIETVSRSMSELRRRGTISLAHPRRVQIVDRPGLQALAGCSAALG